MADASGGRSNLIILAAPHGLLAGVRDVLQDWSAIGLVQSFCWVENPPVNGPGQAMAIEVENGIGTPIRLAELLPRRQSSRIRLCVLVPEFAKAAALDSRVEYELAQLIRLTAGASAPQDYLRLIVTRPDCWPGASPVAEEGWHNVVVSPEDAFGPSMAHQQLAPTDDPFEIGPHTAAAVCGLTGLWAGFAEAPLDERELLPAEQVRVARTFFRYLDADEVDTQLRDGVLSMAGGLPLPMVGTDRAIVVEDVPQATSQMADNLWAKHAAVLRGSRAAMPAIEIKEIRGLRLVKEFFAFLGAAILGAPLGWSRALARNLASGVAGALQRTLLGGDQSAYRVVVFGIGADGLPAGWNELGSAAGRLSELVADPTDRVSQLGNTDMGHVWRDYVRATLTLADAGDRSPQLPPISLGVSTGVLPRTSDCAPGPGSDFDSFQDGLHHVVGRRRIEAADVLGIVAVRERLSSARSDGSAGVGADQALGALNSWAAQHHHSFAVQSAGRLGRAVIERREEVKALLAALAQAGEELEPDEMFREKQRRLGRWMRGLLVAVLLVLVALGVLGGLDELEWTTAAICAGVAVVLWFVASLITFSQSQASFFAELHRRQVAEAQAEINARNLGYAAIDLRRVTGAYGQHLAWSRVIGTFLVRPFGGSSAKAPRAVLSEEGLPLAVRFGVAQPEPATLANTVAIERRGRYRAGWLSEPWEQEVADAPNRLGPEGVDLRDDPSRLYSEKGGGGSLLSRWVELVCSQGPRAASADDVWRRMNVSASPLAQRLVERVQLAGGRELVSRDGFMSSVDAAGSAPPTRPFDGVLFTPEARVEEKDAVSVRWQQSAQFGLSKAAVLVEFSAGLPAFELVALGPTEQHPYRFDDDRQF